VPRGTATGGKRRQRVEAGLGHVQPNRSQISARGASGAQAEIQDELIDR